MQQKIIEGLEGTVVSAKRIMAYFQDVASILADNNLPLIWTSPSGLRVTQRYNNLFERQIRTLCGVYKFRLTEEAPDLGLNVRKQALAAAPNIVHSWDAAHLISTVNACHADGVRSFSMVHDSYGTHARNTGTMARILREQAYEMHSRDLIHLFAEEVGAYAEGIDLPDPPEHGDFDISEVLRAEYFFA